MSLLHLQKMTNTSKNMIMNYHHIKRCSSFYGTRL